MPEIQTQLRDYFDDVVERVTEEDIRIRATTERGIPVPSPRFRPRPLAAGAIGFGLAMTLLGVVLAADRLFGAGVSDVGNGGGSGALPSSGQGSPWLFIPVVFGLGLLATGIISTRRKGDMRERGDGLMQTIEKVDPAEARFDPTTEKIKKRNRLLGWLAGILALAVIGLGAWLIVELSSADQSAGFESLPPEVQAAYNGYIDGWLAHDGEAALSFATDDYHFVSGEAAFGRTAQARAISQGEFINFRPETLGTMVTGQGPYYLTQTERIHMTGAPEGGYPGVSTYVIVNVDGSWRVQLHSWQGDI